MLSEEAQWLFGERWFWQVALFALFAIVGIFAANDVSQRHGYGVAILLFGFYACLLWLATK